MHAPPLLSSVALAAALVAFAPPTTSTSAVTFAPPALGVPVGDPIDDPAGADDRTVARGLPLPELSPDDLAAWRDHLRPSPDELGYAAVPWHPDLVAGLRAADAEQRPLLLWLMNGHPLGCT